MERAIYEVETHLSNDKQYAHVNDTIEDVYENIIKKSYAIGEYIKKLSLQIYFGLNFVIFKLFASKKFQKKSINLLPNMRSTPPKFLNLVNYNHFRLHPIL